MAEDTEGYPSLGQGQGHTHPPLQAQSQAPALEQSTAYWTDPGVNQTKGMISVPFSSCTCELCTACFVYTYPYIYILKI